MAGDPIYDDAWRQWLLTVRRQVGLIDIADMIFVRSEHYRKLHEGREDGGTSRRARGSGGRFGAAVALPSLGFADPWFREKPVLFGEKEGKIALANRQKDPLFLFSALARQLGYPSVPRPKAVVSETDQVPALQRRLERMESRLRLLEEELRGGINLARYYGPPKEEKPGPSGPSGPSGP